MHVDNLTPFGAHAMPSMSKDAHDLVLLVIQASFELPRPGRVTPIRQLELQPPPSMTDRYHGAPDCSSLRVEGQSSYTRPGTDIYLTGHAWTPGGRRATHSELHIRVGPCQQSALVLGDRVWVQSFTDLVVTRPAVFERMPILWERSFGGSPTSARGRRLEVAARNPVGRGLYTDLGSADGEPLPNIVDFRQTIERPGDLPEPVGFGPVARHWQPRCSHAGTYDQHWLETRAPLWPEDMDERFFCAAAPGLCAQPHLRGDEAVQLLGVHPDGVINFQLPDLALGARFEFRRRIVDRQLVLDGVDLDTERMSLGLLWRTMVRADEDMLDLQSIVVRELAAWERHA